MRKRPIVLAATTVSILAVVVLAHGWLTSDRVRASNDSNLSPPLAVSNSEPSANAEDQQVSQSGPNLQHKLSPNLAPTVLSEAKDRDELQLAHTNFVRAVHCQTLRASVAQMEKQVQICTNPGTLEFGESCRKNTAGFADRINTEKEGLSTCPTTNSQIGEENYQAIAAAAKAGDFDAQLCFASANFGLERPMSVQELNDYQSNAQTFAEAGLERGDWRMVQLLATPANSLAHIGGPLSSLPIGKPYEVYRMNRLLRLGATGDYANFLDEYSKSFAAKLNPDAVDRANSWAQTEYQQYFKGSPELNSAPQICPDPAKPVASN